MLVSLDFFRTIIGRIINDIKSLRSEMTSDAALYTLAETQVCDPITDDDGAIMTDDIGEIYSL